MEIHERHWPKWQLSRMELIVLTDAEAFLRGRRMVFTIFDMVIGRTAAMGADGLCR